MNLESTLRLQTTASEPSEPAAPKSRFNPKKRTITALSAGILFQPVPGHAVEIDHVAIDVTSTTLEAFAGVRALIPALQTAGYLSAVAPINWGELPTVTGYYTSEEMEDDENALLALQRAKSKLGW